MKQLSIFSGSVAGIFIFVLVFSTPIMGMFALGPILSPGGVFGAARDSVQRSETVKVSGIGETVTIVRDNWGVPHIYGENWEDIAFALGYVHGVDRLFQMEMIARTGMGRMAEILGPSALEDDVWYLRVGVLRAAEEMLETYERERGQNPDLDRVLWILDAYCEGVNTVVRQRIRTGTLPLEFHLLGFEPSEWTPLKALVFNRLMSLMLTFQTYDLHATLLRDRLFGGDEALMEELFPVNQSRYQVPVVPTYGDYEIPTPPRPEGSVTESSHRGEEDELMAIYDVLHHIPESVDLLQRLWVGSNNWVASGSKTTTGRPILANDMHLGITLPHIWYEAHMVASEDGVNVYGYTLPGVPAVVVGFNTHIAWGFTNVGNDGVDWYEYVWMDGKYWSGREDGWKEPTDIEVVIPVKGQVDHVETFRFTEDGVLMTEMGMTLAMKWTATVEPTYEVLAFYGLNMARNWREFNESMRHFMDPTQNVVYADADGNIALRPTGRFIKRSRFGEGRFVLNGSDPTLEKDWEFIPYGELPIAMNPTQGYLASANQKTAGPGYPYYISSAQAPGYRGRSINRLLSGAPDGSIDVDFMMDAQCGDGGIYDVSAEAFAPYLIGSIEKYGPSRLDSVSRDAYNALKGWNDDPSNRYLMRKDLVGPTIFQATMNLFRRLVWDDEYEEAGVAHLVRPQDNTLEHLVREHPDSPWFDDIETLGETEDRDDLMVEAFLGAVDDLREEFGPDIGEWAWGGYHQMYIDHLSGIQALGRGPYPHDGSGYTLLAAGGRRVRHGPSQRMVVDLSDPSNCWSVIPGGESGVPTNNHYDDQIAMWLDGVYHPMFIEENPETFPQHRIGSKLILVPGGGGTS